MTQRPLKLYLINLEVEGLDQRVQFRVINRRFLNLETTLMNLKVFASESIGHTSTNKINIH